MKCALLDLFQGPFNVDVRVFAAFQSTGYLGLKAHLGFFEATLLLKVADVSPSVLNNGDFPVVEGLDIGVGKLDKHRAIERVAIHTFNFSFNGNFGLQTVHLLHKLLSEFTLRQLNKVLKVLLLLGGSDQSAAISLMKKVSKHPSDPVFGLNCLGAPFLLSQCRVQVLFRCHLVSFIVY